MKKTFTVFLAAVFLFMLLSFAASADAFRSDGIINEDGAVLFNDYDDDEAYSRQLAEARKKQTLASFIVGGVLLPAFGIVFFSVMWKKKSMPAVRCAIALAAIILYTGLRTAHFCLTF